MILPLSFKIIYKSKLSSQLKRLYHLFSYLKRVLPKKYVTFLSKICNYFVFFSFYCKKQKFVSAHRYSIAFFLLHIYSNFFDIAKIKCTKNQPCFCYKITLAFLTKMSVGIENEFCVSRLVLAIINK